jgi:branched-chain amino acid transport system ATP-binding protein
MSNAAVYSASTSSASGLSADHVSVSFDGLDALSDVGLSVGRHEIVGLIGPNGAGKTTRVNCLSGFQKPSKGRVLLDGKETRSWSPDHFRRQGIARTFQAGRLFKDLTVLENIEVTAVALGSSRRSAAAVAKEMLDRVDLADKASHAASTLPYTDQRRLGIGRALALSPGFVLLDEPAAGMSEAECDSLMTLVASIPAVFGCGVLLIEHNMRVVMSISKRICVLDGGRLLAEGTPREIQQHEGVLAAYLGEDL